MVRGRESNLKVTADDVLKRLSLFNERVQRKPHGMEAYFATSISLTPITALGI